MRVPGGTFPAVIFGLFLSWFQPLAAAPQAGATPVATPVATVRPAATPAATPAAGPAASAAPTPVPTVAPVASTVAAIQAAITAAEQREAAKDFPGMLAHAEAAKAAARAGKTEAVQLLEADALLRVARAKVGLNDNPGAIVAMEEMIRFRDARLGPEHPESLYPVWLLARAYLGMKKAAEAAPWKARIDAAEARVKAATEALKARIAKVREKPVRIPVDLGSTFIFVDAEGFPYPNRYWEGLDFDAGVGAVKQYAGSEWKLVGPDFKETGVVWKGKLRAFSEGLAAVTESSTTTSWGAIDVKGKLVVPFGKASGADFVGGFSLLSDKRGFVDKKGNVVSSDEAQFVRSGKLGLSFRIDARDNRIGYVDRAGRWVLPPQFIQAGEFLEGYAPARQERDDTWGLIDAKGDWVLKPAYRATQGGVYGGVIAVARRDPSKAVPESAGASPVSSVSEPLLWGYVDVKGKTILPLEYPWVSRFRHGFGRMEKVIPTVRPPDGTGRQVVSGVVDRAGRMVWEPGRIYTWDRRVSIPLAHDLAIQRIQPDLAFEESTGGWGYGDPRRTWMIQVQAEGRPVAFPIEFQEELYFEQIKGKLPGAGVKRLETVTMAGRPTRVRVVANYQAVLTLGVTVSGDSVAAVITAAPPGTGPGKSWAEQALEEVLMGLRFEPMQKG